MPQANAKDRLGAVKQHVAADSKIFGARWVSGTGGDHNAVHRQFTKSGTAHLVIPEYQRPPTRNAIDQIIDVVREGIVVVNQGDVHTLPVSVS